MKLKLIWVMVALLGCQNLWGQSGLFIPANLQEAYRNGTRSPDGNPGKHYWQNHARYEIDLSIHPPDRLISGQEQILYFNTSPDTLKMLQFRLIQNVHRPAAKRDAAVDSGYYTDGMEIRELNIGGRKINPVYPAITPENNGTREMVPLDSPLLPGDSIRISIAWSYTLSDSRTTQPRDGVVDSTTFFIAYFYPRVDVYDDITGWNPQDFTEVQEFYNDFSDYRVRINVPHNTIVWATGQLLNRDAVLLDPIVKALDTARNSDRIVNILSRADSGNSTRGNGTQDWEFESDNTTDFAFGISDHYLWDATSLEVDSSSGRRIMIQTAYAPQSRDFRDVALVGRSVIRYLSSILPGIPFPFPDMTVFNGLSAMEYPMMVNDFSDPNPADMRTLTDHEISHSYFPFYMGTDESRYAFMDEGWATFFELMISGTQLGKEQADSLFADFYLGSYIHDQSLQTNHPIITPSGELSGKAYEYNSYGKPALAYLALRDLLGDSLFKVCLQQYMQRWHGKHPVPWDFFFSFNATSGLDLNWFWQNWFFSENYTGISIQDARVKKGICRVSLVNKGGFDCPVDLEFSFENGKDSLIHLSPAIWKKGNLFMFQSEFSDKPQSVRLLHGVFLQGDHSGDLKKL